MPNTVLFVREKKVSLSFYTEYLFQEVELDTGLSVSFKTGLSIWEMDHAVKITGLDQDHSLHRHRGGFELYFEVWDLDKLYSRMLKGDVQMVHQIREQPWGQRVFRCIDPDGHFIEVGEELGVAARRMEKDGKKVEEIAQLYGLKVSLVKEMLKKGKKTPSLVRKMAAGGKTVEDISKEMKLSSEIIRELL